MSKNKLINKLINMNGNNNDIYYRYKMPEVNVIKQGAFFAIINIDDIIKPKYINRDILQIKKFLNKYFHTSFNYKNNSLITSVSITQNKVQQSIFEYINKYIICSKCNSPETDYYKDNRDEYNKCKSCGNIDNIYDFGIINKYKIKDKQDINKQDINKQISIDKKEESKVLDDFIDSI